MSAQTRPPSDVDERSAPLAQDAPIKEDKDLFEVVGQQVEAMRLGQGDPSASNEAKSGDGPPVDEIESLCMNCHENVRLHCPSRTKLTSRVPLDSSSRASRSSARSS